MADSTFVTLLKAALADISSADYTALRWAYTKEPAYSPYPTEKYSLRQQMAGEAVARQDWDEASLLCSWGLEDCFVAVIYHLWVAVILKAKGNPKMEQWHVTFANGLIGSIFESGDGKTPETAFRVISTMEEYLVLDLMKVKHSQQALIRHDGKSFDRFTIADSDPAQYVYFDVSNFVKKKGK